MGVQGERNAHRAELPDKVDFWQPSPHGFKAITPGAPFFFRLGAPHKAIAGYVFFARYERVPVWLAWGWWLRRDDGAHRGDSPPHGERPPRPSFGDWKPGMRKDAQNGFIVNTDFAWFSHFLHRAEPPGEVDSWQPSPHGFKAIPPGAPFFFLLGAPHKTIAGYGFFARYERVPVWLAWG